MDDLSEKHDLARHAKNRLARIGTWWGTAGLYFALAAGMIHLTSDGRDIASVWPANAIILALLLARRRGGWFSCLSAAMAGNLLANYLTRGTIAGPILFGLCNVAEITIATLLLRPHLGEALLGSRAVVGRFIVVAGLAAPSVSAVGGAATAWLLFNRDFAVSCRTWFLSDSLGLLIFTPVLLAVFNGSYARFFLGRGRLQRAEAIALQMLTGILAYGVFFLATPPLLSALFAPVMLATVRMGRLGTKLSVLLIAVIGAIGTLRGLGPVTTLTADHVEQAQLFQAFLAVLLLTCLPMAADMSERRSEVMRLTESEAALRLREAELSRIAATDSLTGVFNRGGFRDKAIGLLGRRDLQPVCLVAIDLDRFKHVNDQHGHQVGDAALVHLVSILRAEVRNEDVIGRLGGDEFMILLPATDLHEAEALTARLQAALGRSPLHLDGGTSLLLSISCGTARHEDGRTFDTWVKEADAALYRAKAGSRSGGELALEAAGGDTGRPISAWRLQETG